MGNTATSVKRDRNYYSIDPHQPAASPRSEDNRMFDFNKKKGQMYSQQSVDYPDDAFENQKVNSFILRLKVAT